MFKKRKEIKKEISKEEPKEVLKEEPKEVLKEEVKEISKEEEVKKIDFYGKRKIKVISIEKKEINDRIYNEIKLIDGTTILASDLEVKQNLNLD